MSQLTLLDGNNLYFPPVHFALDDPDGLLAIGGDLSSQRLIRAYEHGIFPWFNEQDPIMWWSPKQRCVIFCDQFHVSKSLAKFLRKTPLKVTLNTDFSTVINQCRQPRKNQPDTWIDNSMTEAYTRLHHQGYAHSVEVWHEEKLIGGLYGLFVNNVFCGESIFSLIPNGSKIALYALSSFLLQRDVNLIDCQLENPHLMSLGATLIPRQQFIQHITLAPSRDDINWMPQELSIV